MSETFELALCRLCGGKAVITTDRIDERCRITVECSTQDRSNTHWNEIMKTSIPSAEATVEEVAREIEYLLDCSDGESNRELSERIASRFHILRREG